MCMCQKKNINNSKYYVDYYTYNNNLPTEWSCEPTLDKAIEEGIKIAKNYPCVTIKSEELLLVSYNNQGFITWIIKRSIE
jgi:hypothetical protein